MRREREPGSAVLAIVKELLRSLSRPQAEVAIEVRLIEGTGLNGRLGEPCSFSVEIDGMPEPDHRGELFWRGADGAPEALLERIPVHSAITVFVLLGLALTWRNVPVRNLILIGLASYVVMRVWSGIYFIPEMLSFQKIPLDAAPTAELTMRVSKWTFWTRFREPLDIISFLTWLLAFGNSRRKLAPSSTAHDQNVMTMLPWTVRLDSFSESGPRRVPS